MTGDTRGAVVLDTTVAHPARRYDYWLGGKDNFEADRISAEAIKERFPDIVTAVRENRLFLRRAVRYAVDRMGVTQFLDIGTGLPTADNTHEVAQAAVPESRIVYVDNDPLVLVHARALLTGSPEGATAYIDADVRNPETILTDAALRKTLDLDKPVALMLVALMHFLTDADNPYRVVATLLDALPPGSLLVLSHASYDLLPADASARLTQDDYPGKEGFFPRTRAQVDGFFTGLDLLGLPENDDKHVGLISEWCRGPEHGRTPPGSAVSTWGGMGRKP